MSENVDEVWDFLEEKLKTTVPNYFKHILKVCGYDNVITIASIEEDDVQYFEQQVRNGSVSKYFERVKGFNILDGSTKTIENFEFTRGHKQFLIYIRDFLKNYLKENVPDSLVLENSINKQNDKDAKLKGANHQTLPRNLKFQNKKEKDLQNKLKITDMNRDMKIHQGILICKVIMSLINTTPTLYAVNMEQINEKISKELVGIQIKDNSSADTHKISEEKLTLSTLDALSYCPFCSMAVIASHKPTEVYNFLWDVSNFIGHLELFHLHQSEYIDSNTINDKVIDEDDIFLEANVQQIDEKKDNQKNKFITNGTITSPSISSKHIKSNGDNGKVNEKLISKSIVCYADTSLEEEELHSYSEILIRSSTRSFKAEQNKQFLESSETLSPKCFPKNHAGELTKELHRYDKTNDVILPQVGNYVICSLFVKDTTQWPANTNIMKNFVGKICGIKDNAKNTEATKEIDIQLLNKCCYSKFKFNYPGNIETSRISRNKIVKILEDPVQNRRGEFVFKDKSVLDFIF